MKHSSAFALVLSLSVAQAWAGEALLAPGWPAERLLAVLVSRESWRPFPRAGEEGWAAVPTAVRAAHIAAGEARLGSPWPSLPATLFLEYVRDGNRTRYQEACFARRGRLAEEVLAEAIEANGRFLDDILDGIWLICEETYWGVPAHVGAQRAGEGLPDVEEPTVDLFAAETAALLAWTDYLLGERLDTLSPLLRQRIAHEIERRLLAPCRQRDDFWWMGTSGRRVNNWNPWICSNWLACILLLEQDPARRASDVGRLLAILDRFTSGYPSDGGCDEGPGYWHRAAASYFDCLELLASASAGAIDVYGAPLVQEMGRYIRRAQLDGEWFLAFADAAPRTHVEAPVVFRYGRAIGDAGMVGLAAQTARAQDICETAARGSFGHLGRSLPALFCLADLCAAEPALAPEPEVWLPELQVLVAREEAAPGHGFVVAAKGGHNDESHNHNDVGNLIVLHDGAPVLVDAGVGEYTRTTFSSQRYSIWTMRSSYHNLPSFTGVEQRAGRRYAAREVRYSATAEKVELCLDLAGAYPAEAKLERLERSMTLDRRERELRLVDRWRFAEGAPDAPAIWYLLTPRRVEPADPEGLRLLDRAGSAPDVLLVLEPSALRVELESLTMDDAKLARSWPDGLTRIVLTLEHPAPQGAWSASLRAER